MENEFVFQHPVNTASVDFGEWIMEPARQAQRIAMLPPRPENMSDAEYPRKHIDRAALAAAGNKLKKALTDNLPAAARWALTNDKIFIKTIDKTQEFFDKRALGKLFKTPAGRLILDSVPLIANAVSLYEFTTGTNAITGENLNSLERAAAGLGIVPAGSVLKNVLKGAARVDAIAKIINGLEKTQTIRDAARMAAGGSGMGISAFPNAPREISNQIGGIAERSWSSFEDKMRGTMNSLTSSFT